MQNRQVAPKAAGEITSYIFTNFDISGPAHSNDDPGGEHHGAGVHRHDERGGEERAHLLPRVLPHRAQKVPRGRR